jgi:hypothetical protein
VLANPRPTKRVSIIGRLGPDDVITLDIPMEIDAGEGKTWADATFGEQ